MLQDLDRPDFERRIANTRAGQYFVASWNQQISAVAAIKLAAAHGSARDLDLARRLYIQASENCSRQLDLIKRKYNWPLTD